MKIRNELKVEADIWAADDSSEPHPYFQNAFSGSSGRVGGCRFQDRKQCGSRILDRRHVKVLRQQPSCLCNPRRIAVTEPRYSLSQRSNFFRPSVEASFETVETDCCSQL